MGSTRSHPLPAGIFVEMSNEFDGWTEKDFDDEIRRLKKRVKELKKLQKNKTLSPIEETEDEDDIMNDPDVREMVENGEHICHMFDAHCPACEEDEHEDEEEVRVTQRSKIRHADKLRAHFC
jgi:hypothetical protein